MTEPLTHEELIELLAEATGATVEEIERGADAIEIEPPEDGDWMPLEEGWEESPAYQDYTDKEIMAKEPTHEELVEQAESVLAATRASMYYPVAHGEAERLQEMIEYLEKDR